MRADQPQKLLAAGEKRSLGIRVLTRCPGDLLYRGAGPSPAASQASELQKQAEAGSLFQSSESTGTFLEVSHLPAEGDCDARPGGQLLLQDK